MARRRETDRLAAEKMREESERETQRLAAQKKAAEAKAQAAQEEAAALKLAARPVTAPAVVSGDAKKLQRLAAMRRKQKLASARAICNQDIAQYGLIWEDMVAKQLPGIVRLEEMVDNLSATLPRGEPTQPLEVDGFSSSHIDYLALIMMLFEDHEDTMFTKAEQIAQSLNFRFHPGPAKGDERSIEKAQLAYGGDKSKLKDLRRASIVCENISQVCDLVSALFEGLNVLRVKNRFHRDYDAANESAGYRDLQLNVLADNEGLVWELQVHVTAIEKYKSEQRDKKDESGRTGHRRYVAFREIKERLE